MLNEGQRRSVWEEWLSAEIRANYFADLAGHYHRLQRLATWLTLLLSSGAAATLLAKVADPWLPPVLALLAAAVSLYSVVAQNLKSAIEASDLHFRWNRLAIEYEDLWNSLEAEDALARLARLNATRAEVSKSGTAFPYRERRMLRWYELVVKRHARPQAA